MRLTAFVLPVIAAASVASCSGSSAPPKPPSPSQSLPSSSNTADLVKRAVSASLGRNLNLHQRVTLNGAGAVITTFGVINPQKALVDEHSTGSSGRVDAVHDAGSYFVRDPKSPSAGNCWRLSGTTRKLRAALHTAAGSGRLAAGIAFGAYPEVFPALLPGATVRGATASAGNGSLHVPIAIDLAVSLSKAPSPVRPLILSMKQTQTRISSASLVIDQAGKVRTLQLRLSYWSPSGLVSAAIKQTYERSLRPPRLAVKLPRCPMS
jgi:hypothetical protein